MIADLLGQIKVTVKVDKRGCGPPTSGQFRLGRIVMNRNVFDKRR